jgi:hypothetical protein
VAAFQLLPATCRASSGSRRHQLTAPSRCHTRPHRRPRPRRLAAGGEAAAARQRAQRAPGSRLVRRQQHKHRTSFGSIGQSTDVYVASPGMYLAPRYTNIKPPVYTGTLYTEALSHGSKRLGGATPRTSIKQRRFAWAVLSLCAEKQAWGDSRRVSHCPLPRRGRSFRFAREGKRLAGQPARSGRLQVPEPFAERVGVASLRGGPDHVDPVRGMSSFGLGSVQQSLAGPRIAH